MSKPPVKVVDVDLPPIEFCVQAKIELVIDDEPKLICTVEIPPYEVEENYRGLKIALCKVNAQLRQFEIPLTPAWPDLDDPDWSLNLAIWLGDELSRRILKDDLKPPRLPSRPRESKSEFVLKCARRMWQWDEVAKEARFIELSPLDLVEAAGFFDESHLINRRKGHGIKTHQELVDLCRACSLSRIGQR